MKQYMETGKIINTHGIKGELKIEPWSDDPEFLLELERVFIDKIEYTVESSRVHQGNVLMKLSGIDSIDDAMRYKNKLVFFDRDDVELSEDSYFIQDLLGFDAYDIRQEKVIGRLTNVEEYPAGDMYIVKKDGVTHLIPEVFLKEVDLEGKQIIFETIKGLAEDNE